MRRILLLLFFISGLFGSVIVGWASLGDSSIIAGTGAVYESLRVHGQEQNVALRNDLYNAVLRLKWPWAVVQWPGVGVVVISVIGIVVVWRERRV
jgi:hypothetical protein